MRALMLILLLSGCHKNEPRADVDAARPEPVAVLDAGAEVEHGPDIADAVAQLEALEEVGVDAAAATDATYGATKIAPKGALDPKAVLTRDRFRFRACAGSLPDAGAIKVVLTIKVGEGGEVLKVTASDTTWLGDCLRDAAAHMHFDEPKGGTATLEVPIEVVRR